MTKKSIFKLMVAIVGILVCLNISFAQEKPKTPSEQLGLGIKVGDGAFGGQGAFALTPNIHLGAGVGFYYDSGDDFENGQSFLYFSPYFKMFLDPIKTLYPMLIASFDVTSLSITRKDVLNRDVTVTETNTGISVAVGGEWFPYSSVGVYGGFKFLTFNFDPSQLTVGLGYPFIGIEWFPF